MPDIQPGTPPDLRRCQALVDEIDELLAELRREILAAASGQDLSPAGAAAVISALVDPQGVDVDAREAARAWLRAWESLA